MKKNKKKIIIIGIVFLIFIIISLYFAIWGITKFDFCLGSLTTCPEPEIIYGFAAIEEFIGIITLTFLLLLAGIGVALTTYWYIAIPVIILIIIIIKKVINKNKLVKKSLKKINK